jgi:CBS domain-containing protein
MQVEASGIRRMDSGQLDESGRIQERENMNIQEVMDTELLTIAPEATLREAAQRMSGRNVGAALLLDAAIGSYLGIITERDLLNAIAAGDDPDVRRVADSATSNIVSVSADASLEQAAQKMIKGGFRHLLVVTNGDAIGIISMRDLVVALVEH